MKEFDPDFKYMGSLLKFIDTEYMTKEDYDKIEDFDFNIEEDQIEIIRRLIVIGINAQYNDFELDKFRHVLGMCMDLSEKEIEELFQIYSPCDDILDKKGFINNIYKELLNLYNF